VKPESSKCEAVVIKIFFLGGDWCRADPTEPRARYCCRFGTEPRKRPCCQTWLKVAAKLFTRVKDEEGQGGRGVRWAVIVTRGRFH
jgi:hypothetical protein